MTTPVDVLVAVPARDEADSIETCLAAVVTAAQEALERGTARRVRVAVGAHRCQDRTAERATASCGRPAWSTWSSTTASPTPSGPSGPASSPRR